MNTDISLRGSGELMHLIKEKKLCVEDIMVFCNMIWRVNSETCTSITDAPVEILKKLESLDLIRIIENGLVMLNPHVAGIGDQKQRGEFRVKFKKLT